MVESNLLYEVIETDTFVRWVSGLRDQNAIARVNTRVRNVARGLLGDSKSIGGQLFELRIDYGPGYRLYVLIEGNARIVFLWGGDKSSQRRDIRRARQSAREWRTSGG